LGLQDTLDRDVSASDAFRPHAFELLLLGGFELRCDGAVIEVAPSSQRLLAFLALTERPLPRAYVAGALWPDTTEEKAGANLRTALWRLGPQAGIVSTCLAHLALRGEVWVDARFVHETAQRLRRTADHWAPDSRLDGLRGELLPGCWDSWLVFERERLRQDCIHINERCCIAALQRGDTYAAVRAALGAVECDPLREASNALLIRAYLRDGDRAQATRRYEAFADLLHRELGVGPAAATAALLADPAA
jgi:DNA-binding SARP family transcriptional activator